MDTAEPPVRHDKNLIAGVRLGNDGRDEPLKIVLDTHSIAKRRERSRSIPAEVRAIAKNPVSLFEACGQAVLQQAGSHRV